RKLEEACPFLGTHDPVGGQDVIQFTVFKSDVVAWNVFSPAGESNTSLRVGSQKSRNETPPPSYFDLAKSETTKIPSDQTKPPKKIQNNAKPPNAPPGINNLPVHCDSCWRNQSALLRLSAHLHQSATTILRNDLGTGQTIPTMLPPNLYHSPEIRQVVLHRNGTCQRFGMKLERTDSPEQITYIAMILPRSPACDAGLQVGDRILTINGSSVDSMTLESAIDLIRTTSRILQLTYEPRPFTSYLLTMVVRKQDGKVGIRLKSQEDLQIDVVLPHSPAARVGLRAGQKLIGLNGQNVVYWDHSDAMKWLRAYPDEQDLLITVSETPIQPEKEEQLDTPEQLTETSHRLSEDEITNETYFKHNIFLSRSNCSECPETSFHDHCAEVVDHRLCNAARSHLLQNDIAHCECCAETSPSVPHPSSQGQSNKVPPQRQRGSLASQLLEGNESNEDAHQNRYVECVPLTGTNQKEMQNGIPLRLSFTVPSHRQCEGQTLDFGDPSEQKKTSAGTQSCSSSLCSKFLITTATSPMCNESQRRNYYSLPTRWAEKSNVISVYNLDSFGV
ncbi:PDZ/DHR/GLGF domain protein, partial [Opisthorchis viverrini]